MKTSYLNEAISLLEDQYAEMVAAGSHNNPALVRVFRIIQEYRSQLDRGTSPDSSCERRAAIAAPAPGL